MLAIVPLVLGPVATNAYLIADSETGEAAVIDPAWDGQTIVTEAQKRGWRIGQMWYTHAHFDHIGGAAAIAKALQPPPQVAMHSADRFLWKVGGGGQVFGFGCDRGPEPSMNLALLQTLSLGALRFDVRQAPGHTPGLCIFYCPGEKTLFSGDLIFRGSVGRTDLPGGNWTRLNRSIREQVFTLPDETRILPGHGPETTVGEEKALNPVMNEN